jgi:hypothetical protein
MPKTITIERGCMLCGKPSSVTVDDEGYQKYRKGAFVQDAFPHLSADEREIIISGSHPGCFNEAFDEHPGGDD